MLIIYGADTNNRYKGFTIEEWFLNQLGFAPFIATGKPVYEIIKIIKASTQPRDFKVHKNFYKRAKNLKKFEIESLLRHSNLPKDFFNINPELYIELKNSGRLGYDYIYAKTVKFINKCNEKNKPKTHEIYSQINSSPFGTMIKSEFSIYNNTTLLIETKQLSELSTEEKSQIRTIIETNHAYQQKGEVPSEVKFSLEDYINEELEEKKLKFIEILTINNRIKGFITFQLDFDVPHKEIIVYLRLADVDMPTRVKFLRIMTILTTRIGFALQEIFPDFTVYTFFEAISSVSVGILAIPGIESSLLYDLINALIRDVYQKLYPPEVQKQIVEHEGYYYREDPLTLKNTIRQQVAHKNDITTYTDLFCKRFDRYKEPLDQKNNKQHAMLVLLPNSPHNKQIFNERIMREFANPKINLTEKYQFFGQGLLNLIEQQTIPKTISPQKLMCRL